MTIHSFSILLIFFYLACESADCLSGSVGKIINRANRKETAQTIIADCRKSSRSDAAALRTIWRAAELTRRDSVFQIRRQI